jgi:hydroxymethylglutaryl-CoA reductase (NADPH)
MVSISSNDCADKKPSRQVKKEGRGLSVIASIKIAEETLKKVLKTDMTELKKVYEAKIITGSQKASLIGQNAHHGNIISAFFAATGQDLAHGAEMSIGDTQIKFNKDHLVFSVVLPDVMIGAIGGGTSLPLQKQIIDLMGLKKPLGNGERRKEMAEVLAVGVLSGELSLMCALASHRLASSHNEFRKGIK